MDSGTEKTATRTPTTTTIRALLGKSVVGAGAAIEVLARRQTSSSGRQKFGIRVDTCRASPRTLDTTPRDWTR
jgi:hypothetical protein